jgi:glycosyltransferase involved in cell wall biosynthesis
MEIKKLFMDKVCRYQVVYDHQIFLLQQFGGISRYFCELASRLSQNGAFDVSVIAPFHVNQHLQSTRGCKVIGNYFPDRFVGAKRIRRWGRKLAFRYLYWSKNKTDIIHETYYSLNPWGSAHYRVVSVYDMTHELFAEDPRLDPSTTIAKRAAVSRADHVICISESTKQDLIRLFGVDERKTSVVHLGFTLNTDETVRPAKLASEKPYLLYVGIRWGYKNFIQLCRVFSSSSLKRSFDLVAFGGGAFSMDEVAEMNQLGITNCVHQVGGDDGLLASYYQGATAFIYPSLYEGFGIPPLEAMNFGCPVVCSNTSSFPEVVGDAAVLFDPASEESMRVAIEDLLRNDGLRAEMIRRGYARVQHFSWAKCAAETAAIYRQICLG